MWEVKKEAVMIKIFVLANGRSGTKFLFKQVKTVDNSLNDI